MADSLPKMRLSNLIEGNIKIIMARAKKSNKTNWDDLENESDFSHESVSEKAFLDKMPYKPNLPHVLRSLSLFDVLRDAGISIEEALIVLKANYYDDKQISEFINLYNESPTKDLESICIKLNIQPSKLYGKIAESLYESGLITTNLIVSNYQPLMVKRAIELALSDGGYEPLKEFLIAAGVFVTPKGSGVNISTTNQQLNVTQNNEFGLPKFEDTLAIGERAINEARPLELNEASSEVIDVEAREVEKVEVEK
jgi:hypothetical protein